jgi:hypothetical protein
MSQETHKYPKFYAGKNKPPNTQISTFQAPSNPPLLPSPLSLSLPLSFQVFLCTQVLENRFLLKKNKNLNSFLHPTLQIKRVPQKHQKKKGGKEKPEMTTYLPTESASKQASKQANK